MMKTQFGRFGGQFVPPPVLAALNEVEAAFNGKRQILDVYKKQER